MVFPAPTSQSAKAPVAHLTLVGGFRLRVAGQEIEVPIRKSQALLALMALSPDGGLHREKAHGLLWSEHPQDRASANLRQCIHDLRHRVFQPLGLDVLDTSRTRIALLEGTVHCDVWEHCDTILRGKFVAVPADTCWFDRVLEGLEHLDPAFNDWLNAQRAGLRTQMLRMLQDWTRANAADTVRAGAAARLLAIDPMDETACRVLIRHHIANGEPAEALSVYQALWSEMDEAFGEEPSPETQRLIVELKTRGGGPAPNPGGTDRPWIVVPAVCPKGLGPRGARLADGFRGDLLSALARFREWRVLSGEAGQTAGAPGYRAEMSVTDADDALQVSVLLLDLGSGTYLWSERFTTPLTEWSASQGRIVRKVAAALDTQIARARIERLVGDTDFALDIYDAWLQGHNLVMEYTADSWARAEAIFTRLIDRAPRFARTFASMAGMENTRHLAFPGYRYAPDRGRRAMDFARQAVRLDPMDARAQLCFGWSCAMNGDHGLSELAFILAHQNNENDPWTTISAATGLAFCDRSDAAGDLVAAFHALRPDPSAMDWSYLAAIHFMAGDYDACVTASERAEEITADVPAWHAAALVHLNRAGEAHATGQRLIQRVRQQWAVSAEPTRAAIADWIAHSFPIRSSACRTALATGLSKAGLPEAAG